MKLNFLLFTLFISFFSQAQSQLTNLNQFIQNSSESKGFMVGDLDNLVITDQYSYNGNTYVYVQQFAGKVGIYNAINTYVIDKNGKVHGVSNNFITELKNKIDPSDGYNIEPIEAFIQTAKDLKIDLIEMPSQKSAQRGPNQSIFEKGNLSLSDIKVTKHFFLSEDNLLIPVYQVEFEPINGTDFWNYLVNAKDGSIVQRNSYTTHCQFEKTLEDGGNDPVLENTKLTNAPSMTPFALSTNLVGESTYNVWGLPLEAPSFGSRSVQQAPFDLNASPFGWHDIDGQPGADFQITRGNNVHAFHDANADYLSANDEPNGGTNLVFNESFDPALEPTSNSKNAIVQLFYMVNMMHDIAYANGFTEVAGNFQINNYGKGGQANDAVVALGQFDSNLKNNRNNADFSTPADGGNGQMRMFLWDRSSNSYFTVYDPPSIAGVYPSSTSTFSKIITETPLNGNVVEAYDISSKPTLGCAAIENSLAVSGKIALIDRGSCFFKAKALNAQAAGAIGLIICNFEEALVDMGGTTPTGTVNIPVVMLTRSRCTGIREKLSRGENVSVGFVTPIQSGPAFLDGTLDNGIIAHEFAHGISNRLTGGPSQAGCLGNDEQMGEGWSDFFSLVTTSTSAHQNTTARGVGTYAESQPTIGRGIRSYPYSTDMSINPETYESIIGVTGPHPLGATWNMMIWELYWKLVEKYGFDGDLIHGNKGNNKAIKLVIEGMRLQPCSPGFVDGRDAILLADKMLYAGENQCLIWEAFAKRGLGYLANQGLRTTRNDAFENFEAPPSCIKELKIIKTATDFIKPGDNITVRLSIINHKETQVQNVVVTDILPSNTQYLNGSSSLPSTITGNMISFNLAALNPNDTIKLSYIIKSDPSIYSRSLFFDGAENGVDLWDFVVGQGSNEWFQSTNDAYKGIQKYKVPTFSTASQQYLQLLENVTLLGENPELRFFYKINTENGSDGGILELSQDNGRSWIELGSRISRNGYRGKISYQTFVIPNLRAYWGNSGTAYKEVHVDLKDFKNKPVLVRFSFASNDTIGTVNQFWQVDNIELVDAKYYQSQACVSSQNGDNACTTAPSKGTYIESDIVFSTNNTPTLDFNFAISPNPTSNSFELFLQEKSEQTQSYKVEIINLQGVIQSSKKLNAISGMIRETYDISGLSSGMYLVNVIGTTGNKVSKLIKQ